MLRQAAFEGENALLKGGLHCHTTRSDGKGTPEEVIAMHAQHGYDFLALTDHRTYNYKDYLPESGVLIIPGMEFDRTITNHHRVHCFHTVWIGPEKPENPYEQDQPFQRGYVQDQYEFQQFLDEAHRNKQLTIYCHPQWSGTFAREFERLQGNFAMELWNSGCVMENGVDFNNGPLWDELLCQGKRIFGVATDDGHAMEQHCRGWVRVNAQKNVNDILRALREGAFYASTGPEIYDFYIDDNKVAHVKCSPCATVKFFCSRVTKLLRSEDGSPITEMARECPVRDDLFYLRVEVTDADGHVAWSNPIFLEEMK